MNFDDLDDAKRILREIKLLCHFQGHSNVLSIKDVFTYPNGNDWNDVYICTAFFQSDLGRILENPNQPLTKDHVRWFAYQLFCALKFLHSAGVLHRDLKPQNILIKTDCQLAVADFGLSRFVNVNVDAPSVSSSSLLSTETTAAASNLELTRYVVTRWYRSPELLVNNSQYDGAVDVWSVGVIIAEMMAKVKGSVLPSMRGDKIIRGSFVLLKGTDYSQQLRLTMRTLGSPADDSDLAFIESKNAVEYIKAFEKKEMRYPRIKWSDMFPTLPIEALDLLDKSLHFNPKKRLTVSEALSHPWLSDYHNAAEERDSSLISETEWSWDRLPRGMLTKSIIQKLVHDEIVLFDSIPRSSSSSTTTSRLTTGAVPRAHLSRVTSFTENTSVPLPPAAAVVIPSVGIPMSSSSSSTAVSIASLNTQRIAATTTLSGSESVKTKIVSFSGSAIPTRNTNGPALPTSTVTAVAATAPVQVVTLSVSTNPTRQALQPVVMSVNRPVSGEISASTVKESMIKDSGGMKKDSLLTTSSTSKRPVTASAAGTGTTSISSSMNSGGSVVPPPPSKLAPKAPLIASASISLNDSVIVNALTGQINALKADLLTILDYRMQSFTQRLDSIEKRLDDKKTTETKTETLKTLDKE